MAGRFRTLWLVGFAFVLSGCGDSLREYRDEAGRFVIRFPAEPSPPKKGDPPLAPGVRAVRVAQRSGSFAVAWEDIDRKDGKLSDDERLDAACEAAAKALKGKEVSRKAIALEGKHPGRELILATASGKTMIHDRMYLVEGRLYQVVAQGEKWWIESPGVGKVLDSFKVIEE